MARKKKGEAEASQEAGQMPAQEAQEAGSAGRVQAKVIGTHNKFLSGLYGGKKHGCFKGCWNSFENQLPEVGQAIHASAPRRNRPEKVGMSWVTFGGVTEEGDLILQRPKEPDQVVDGALRDRLVWHSVDFDASVCCAFGLSVSAKVWHRDETVFEERGGVVEQMEEQMAAEAVEAERLAEAEKRALEVEHVQEA